MLRCTCCGRWTVEVIADLDRGRGAAPRPFYRVKCDGQMWDEYLTMAALEDELAVQGVLEYLAEVTSDA